jgi:hypothetical protein
MPREFRHLVMTNIRRIAHTPAEAECIARLLLMQVILVCVAHAAHKTWYSDKLDNGDPDEEVTVPEGFPGSFPRGTDDDRQDSAGTPCCRFLALWEIITGSGDYFVTSLAGPVFPADTGPCR